MSTRTVADVIREWREAGAESDSELASRINLYIQVETKGWKDREDGIIGHLLAAGADKP